ncbi:ATP-binding protein [Kitasatospora sp. NPDC059973]|uniref:ATP-binding protein n=1 Tax=Kitasatospora sp. NPDC059973 TaxID=3347020 RepID=UPI00368BA116
MDRPIGEPRHRRPSGTGKSHSTEGLARAAIEKDLKVTWFALKSLTATINKSKADGSPARTVAKTFRCDLIVVDDMLPAGGDTATAFYQIIDAPTRPFDRGDQQHPPVHADAA